MQCGEYITLIPPRNLKLSFDMDMTVTPSGVNCIFAIKLFGLTDPVVFVGLFAIVM
jgi:hypothetical protein